MVRFRFRAGGIGGIRTSVRNYFSSHLLWQAQQSAIDARTIEDSLVGPTFDVRHRGSVLSAIQASVAFLEAMVNELFTDAADGHGTSGDGYIAPLDPDAIARMAAVWSDTNGGRLGAIAKYQLLLSLSDRPRLDKASDPLNSANLLIQLRNVIVHYSPESLFTDESHKLEGRLRNRFESNLLASPNSLWWPDQCLGSACAEWSWQSALALADAVSDDLSITPNYKRLLERHWEGLGGPPS